jgi:hypothetical protein
MDGPKTRVDRREPLTWIARLLARTRAGCAARCPRAPAGSGRPLHASKTLPRASPAPERSPRSSVRCGDGLGAPVGELLLEAERSDGARANATSRRDQHGQAAPSWACVEPTDDAVHRRTPRRGPRRARRASGAATMQRAGCARGPASAGARLETCPICKARAKRCHLPHQAVATAPRDSGGRGTVAARASAKAVEHGERGLDQAGEGASYESVLGDEAPAAEFARPRSVP